MKNPAATRVPIIQYPEVRRMLIWMKAHTEGFRALLYFTAFCVDRCEATDDEATKEKHNGFLEVLTPICKAYCSDMAFRVTETAMLFASSGKAGKFLIPVSNAYPFLMLMGQVVTAWLLLWEAGVAKEKLGAPDGGGADEAFYEGKLATARYFIKHVLPEVDAAAKAIKSGDLSMMEIADESFAS